MAQSRDNWNLSLFKSFVFSETRGSRLEDSAPKTFNIWNHTQFNQVSNNFGSGNFGQFTSAFDPRIMQLGVEALLPSPGTRRGRAPPPRQRFLQYISVEDAAGYPPAAFFICTAAYAAQEAGKLIRSTQPEPRLGAVPFGFKGAVFQGSCLF